MPLLVNGERIEDAALREEERTIRRLLAERLRHEGAAANEQRVREWARENLIERVLIKRAALRDPEPVSEALNDPDETQRLRIERFVARLTSHVARPRHKDVVEYYRKHREEFHAPEAVHARHIVKNVDEMTSEDSAGNAIEQIRTALREGASFEKLAAERSDCPGRGGDLGYFTQGQMVPEFEGIAFNTPTGEVSDIFRTPFGFHILKVEDHRAEGILPLDAVRAQIEEDIFARKKQKVIEQ